jgi:hypothetical protein
MFAGREFKIVGGVAHHLGLLKNTCLSMAVV